MKAANVKKSFSSNAVERQGATGVGCCHEAVEQDLSFYG
jgi:hypothetical protein